FDDKVPTLADIGLALSSARQGRDIRLARVPLNWPADTYAFREPLDYLGYDGGGGVGSGPGMAVGAALALHKTGRLPVAIMGDGEFLGAPSALWTATHYELPLLIVVPITVPTSPMKFSRRWSQRNGAGRARTGGWVSESTIPPSIWQGWPATTASTARGRSVGPGMSL